MDKVNNSPVSTPTILTDIIQARANIKQKYNALKTGRFETDSLINNTFSSIIGPLNEIKSNIKRSPVQTFPPPPALSSRASTVTNAGYVVNRPPLLQPAPKSYRDLNPHFGPYQIGVGPNIWTLIIYKQHIRIG